MSLTEEPSLSHLDRVRAEAKRFADMIEHPRRQYTRTRPVAALMVAEAIGARFTVEMLRKSGCPHLNVRRQPLYSDPDLQKLAESILDRARKYGPVEA